MCKQKKERQHLPSPLIIMKKILIFCPFRGTDNRILLEDRKFP